MAQGAKVTSIAALREFRPALIKFVEESRAALVAAEGECNRTLEWLRNDRVRYWKKEVRVRQDTIVRCKTELMNKQRSATGDPRSAVEERKALDLAKHRLDEAVTKQANTKRWLRQLEKEQAQYKGMAQSLAGQLTRIEDAAIFDLDRMAAALEEYVAMQASSMEEMSRTPLPVKGGSKGPSLARAGGASDETDPPSPFAAYRHATPSAGRRRRAEAVGEDAVTGPSFSLDRVARQKQVDDLRALLMDDPPREGMSLSLSRGALDADRIYLERCGPIDEHDSGWYLGAAEGNPEPDRRELLRAPLDALLALRPDLAPGLRLGAGTLLVAEGGKIVAVTAPNDTLVYHRREDA